MIYSLGLALYLLAASPFYLLRVLRGRYRSSFSARLGRGLGAPGAGRTAWIHACSVGEVEAAVPLVRRLAADEPGRRLIVSTVTETGQERARKLFPEHEVRYLPFDFVFAVRRHLDAAGALEAFYIMETEIWPNLIRELARRGVPVFIANGRISDRAWPRYRRFAFLFRPILALVSAVAARTPLDAERFRFLAASKVESVGNIKYDRPAAAAPADRPAGRFVLFGSTHPGEEEICLRVFRALEREFPGLRAILAPRHIERAGDLAAAGGALRSRGWGDEPILILDTHGELAGFYAIADAAFVGGSLVPVGGHNPLEAAAHGVPVAWGPHVANFRDACDALAGQGGFAVKNEGELFALLRRLLSDPGARRAEGEKARQVVLANRGATERMIAFFARSPRP